VPFRATMCNRPHGSSFLPHFDHIL